ncbi:hypothetical protein F441_12616 [Phytophthora nicotianae CJ01A1]|uniref:Uncharacterized protein n=5 Tax=Phytophthora nicotianae TaxID=4792 RepID=W2PYZ4_PHYN3|nr:hypothetical protein PPTG_23471 [Phytophthora nicotianae INRA-310]ETI42165.1 hypothetical protein F443_12655 [Phytophthora nicotianae P1569]ETM42073.1 hypothetical protein L914_12214 [Phytophthora nicotianae]ETP11931.1 hypothetical protein F441_12616 [Phytophthora nicotianae CJ01A1]ETP40016.1 hypothetical protein F442_12565 [Phytophthora nicotianae P10297]ETN05479.1 hypothetical protein PPTG_23471 [Phytophthora nicotianae INRA-310]
MPRAVAIAPLFNGYEGGRHGLQTCRVVADEARS